MCVGVCCASLRRRQMIEIRGGTVFFETGTIGGVFVGVFFIQDESTPEVGR